MNVTEKQISEQGKPSLNPFSDLNDFICIHDIKLMEVLTI